MEQKQRAPRNRTISITQQEVVHYRAQLASLDKPADLASVVDRVLHQDAFQAVPYLPDECVDLLLLDPPYNLTKTFHSSEFKQRPLGDYAAWLDAVISSLVRILKPTATIYICSEWKSSAAVFPVIDQHFVVRNRITWEREKGRGANANWKNCSEDIWYCTVASDFTFNVEAVKLKRRVLAPYTDSDGNPKDWNRVDEGSFRLTHPSNLWTDVTVPFWSMPENTDHPTQKPEKLIAKLILASSNRGDLVFDPFLGSGTTAVVAKKLGRKFIGIELDESYCCLAAKRLELAERDSSIQGYRDGVFWERNALVDRSGSTKRFAADSLPMPLFGRENRD
jgi:site-specific DNA-methyltransferase (adenine-specific)